MSCPACGGESLAFEVPAALREYAPEGADRAGVCTVCLRTVPAAEGDGESFDAVLESFPTGEGGAALALALGKLDSLALERDAIVALCEHAERAGVDVLLTLDRIAAAGSVQPHFDVERRRHQLAQLLE